MGDGDETQGAGRLSRRLLLAAGAVAAAGAAGMPQAAAQARRTPIRQPANPGPAAFAARALSLRDAALAAGDQGFGAVIVKDGRIVGAAPSRVVVDSDPTAHAEMGAIRDACRRLGTRSLAGAVMYGSSPACRMCETAAYWAGIERLYHGAGPADGGRPRYGGC